MEPCTIIRLKSSHLRFLLSMATLSGITLLSPVSAADSGVDVRTQAQIMPLPGKLNQTPVFNSNCPEVVLSEGILLSTLPKKGKAYPGAHLDYAFEGDFEVFLHHIADGKKSGHPEDLYIALVAQNTDSVPVLLKLKEGRTYLSQPDAPFVPLNKTLDNTKGDIFAGPGDRVSTELLYGTKRKKHKDLEKEIKLKPGETRVVDAWPIPVCELTPPLNGRNGLFRFNSSGKVSLAAVALFAKKSSSLSNENLGAKSEPGTTKNNTFKNGVRPQDSEFIKVAFGSDRVEPRGLTASDPGEPGPYRYGRVSGVSVGSKWNCLEDGERLDIKETPTHIVLPLATVKGGTFGTAQEQSASMARRYEKTAHRAHGNYGVLYDVNLPVRNSSDKSLSIALGFDSPVKSDKGNAIFLDKPSTMVFFRGSLEYKVQIPANSSKQAKQTLEGRKHLVLHKGEKGPDLVSFDLDPGKVANVRVQLIYPADSTPPQVISLQAVEK